MAPKSRILPLLLLLSLSALLLYSHFGSSLHRFSQNPNLSANFFTNLNPQKSDNLDIFPLQFGSSNFTFTIKVLAYDRIDSLSRCLRSLANADYGRDRVNINIFIDHFKEFDPKNESEILNGKIEQSHRILEFVDRFVWRFGEKLVHYRTVNVGLQAQWLEAWWPSSDDEFVFVVEDDLEVSPLYYRFLMGLISKYYYEPENFSPSIYGASLQRPRFVAGKHGNKLHVDSGTRLFLYQMVGTWGQLLFPKPWKEFRLWYDIHKAKGIKPILQGMVTTGWYKKMGERIWTPWFIKFIQSRGYYNIYTNFFPDRALSVSHRDPGVNYGKTAGPDSQLIDKRSLDFNLWEMQSLRNLKWYDFCFKEVIPNRVVGSFDELGSVLNAVHELKIVLLVSLYRTPESITRNLLCHFERLDIQNYILIGGDSELLLDLVRRGHPVIDPLQLIKDVRTPKLREFQGSNKEFIMEILVKAYVIKKCVEFGFHTWSINANVVPISKSFSQVPNFPYDFSTGKNLELLFVKSSQATAKIWVEEFIYKMASYANSLMDKTSLSKDQTNFGYIAAKYLEEKGQGINTVDEMSLGVKIDSNNIDNQILLEGAKKMIFWSSVMSLDSIQNRLEDVGMWVIDEGFSCTAVVCHQS